MSLLTIRRRVNSLESIASAMVAANAPPLTEKELDELVRRLEVRDEFSREEIQRLERQGTICRGEFIVRASQGTLTVKRYIGLDVADI